MEQEEAGFFPDFGDELVEVIRGGRTGAGVDALGWRDAMEKAVFAVIDELRFLSLLNRLYDQPQLFADLIIGFAVQIGDPGMHVEDGVDGAEVVFPWVLDIVDEGLGEDAFIAGGAVDFDLAGVFDLVEAVYAGFHGDPVEEVGEPARRDGDHLRHCPGGDGQLSCRDIA